MEKNRNRNIPGTNIWGSDLSPRIGGTSGGHFRTSSAGILRVETLHTRGLHTETQALISARIASFSTTSFWFSFFAFASLWE